MKAIFRGGLLAACLVPLAFAAENLPDGKALYDKQCQFCHGEDARGSDRAPELAASRRLRARSTAQIRATIEKGVPEGGMPAFNTLPAPQLDALANYIHSLNSPAAQNEIPGDPAGGERFFFGA